jgi:hypothetical protein
MAATSGSPGVPSGVQDYAERPVRQAGRPPAMPVLRGADAVGRVRAGEVELRRDADVGPQPRDASAVVD